VKSLDRAICVALQENARLSLSEVAERVGASVPTVSEHVKRMEADGVIRGYHAHLNAAMAGVDVTAFIFVDVDSSTHYDNFRRQCKQRKDVLEVHAITGTASHLVKVRVANTAALEELLSAVQRWKGVTRTLTSVVLSTHKETLIIDPGGE
jgi:Lrp/AsnC family leucine-responsive transcriptional regulator